MVCRQQYFRTGDRWRQICNSKRSSTLPQGNQLLRREPGLVKNGAKGSDSKNFVVWNADTSEGGFAAKDDVTFALTLDCETKSN